MLEKLGIVKSAEGKAAKIFMDEVQENFLENKDLPSAYVKDCWDKYEESGKCNNSLNGHMFELIVATLLIKEGIMPLHLQAEVAFVPNIIFDAVLYTSDKRPIGISIKRSLRERYKQADLEAIALKYVHRRAENYLITMDENEADSVSQKIANGDVLGIDKVIVATTEEFDTFIDELKKMTFIEPGVVDILPSANVVTEEKVNNVSNPPQDNKQKKPTKRKNLDEIRE